MITSYLISMFFSLRGLLRRLFMAGQCNEHVSSLLQICWESIWGMSAIIHHCRFPTLITFSWGAYKSSFWCVSLCVCVTYGELCLRLTWLTFAVLHVTGELESRSTLAGDATLLCFPTDVRTAVILVHAGGSLLCAFWLRCEGNSKTKVYLLTATEITHIFL